MDIFIFDVDDTIIMHTKENNDYYSTNNNSTLKELLSEFKNLKSYIYTNGIFNHCSYVVNVLGLDVEIIFARDVIPYMKPDERSFDHVNTMIKNENKEIKNIFFFDDLKENLYVAKRIGWNTIWINPNLSEKEDYIDYVFPNIYESILYLKRKN